METNLALPYLAMFIWRSTAGDPAAYDVQILEKPGCLDPPTCAMEAENPPSQITVDFELLTRVSVWGCGTNKHLWLASPIKMCNMAKHNSQRSRAGFPKPCQGEHNLLLENPI